MKLGFIGLGRMGSAMAANLLKAGHDVSVFNRSPGKSGPLIELGAHEAANLAAACGGEVVITMLADDDAASDIALGDGGLIDNLPKGAIHLSMSTISVALSKRLAQAHAQAGQRYVAAPVFGRPDMAAAAKLFIVAAGDPATIDACSRCSTHGTEDIPDRHGAVGGESGQAQRQIFCRLPPSRPSARRSRSSVRPASTGTRTSSSSPPRSSPHRLTRSTVALIAEGKFEPAAFAAPLGYKDIRLALAAAETLRVPMPLASLLHDRFLRLFAQGGEKLDWSAIGGLAAQDAGDRQVAMTSLPSSAV